VNYFDPDHNNEKIPDFYTPSRVRLFFKVIQDQRNTHRISRKPMPEKVKNELAKKSKEYAEYKTYESYYLEKEKNLVEKTKENTFSACK
jgi:hypothetical protein